MISKFSLFFTIIFIFLGNFAAQASSPISHVGGATVNEGTTNVDLRAGYTLDSRKTSNHKRLQMRQEIDHAFSDWYAFRVVTFQDDPRGDNLEHRMLRLENRFQLIEKRDYGWDGGIRLLYNHRDGDKTPHEVDLGLFAQIPFGEGWEFRHNSFIEHDIGENAQSGLSLEFRHQLTRVVDTRFDSIKSLRLGVELFNNLDRLKNLSGYSNQDHQIGPVARISFKNGIGTQMGYRTGISRNSIDHLVKFSIGKKF